MRKLGPYLFFLFLSAMIAHAERIPYVSPGIGISWDFDGQFILTPKISFGVYQNKKFLNITFGAAFYSGRNDNHVEIQAGTLTPPFGPRKIQVFCGGGVGLTFPQDKTAAFRFSVFTGNLLYANLNVTLSDTVHSDLGVELPLSIPLKKIEFGSIGG